MDIVFCFLICICKIQHEMVTGKILNHLFIKTDQPGKIILKKPYHSLKVIPNNTFNYLLYISMTAEEKKSWKYKIQDKKIKNKTYRCSVSKSF